MGIRFQCPNGHSLNVKSFLAGKRGICPHCQSRFIIPLQSGGQVAHAPSKRDRQRPNQAPAPQPTASSSPALADARPPGEISPTNGPQASDSFQPYRGPLQYGFPANLPVGTPGAALPVGTPLSDPVAEAPQAVWYVRPPSGGQYGPAIGEVMRSWIAEGRVSADCWVWREGWTDWRQAGTVLPQLAAGATVTTPSDQGSEFPQGNPPHPASETASGHVRFRSRRAANQLTLLLVTLLILIAIGLVGVFMWVVNQQEPSDTTRHEAPPALLAAGSLSAAPLFSRACCVLPPVT